MTTLDGYYWNSLTTWQSDLLKQRRQLMARYASLERQQHPSKFGQGKLIELNAAIIALVSAALAERHQALSPDGAAGHPLRMDDTDALPARGRGAAGG